MAGRATARRRIATLAGLVIAGGLPFVALAAPPAAAVVSVSNETELRAAFTSGADTTLSLSQSIVLADCSTPLVWVNASDLTINGNGHTLSWDPVCATTVPHRVINYLPNSAAPRVITVHNLTITGGVSDQGAGLRAENQDATFGASVVVDQGSVITGNIGTGQGGGIFTQDGNVTLDHATVSNNQSIGGSGGISAEVNAGQSVTATDSTIISNSTTSGAGGGIGTRNLTLTRSTVAHNTASTSGGGVQAVLGTTTITNSTITDNTSGTIGGREGGGILAFASVTNITFSTIVGNKTVNNGGANVEVFNQTSTTLFGSVVAQPLATSGTTENCQGGTFTSSGYNFSDIDDCGFGGGAGDIESGGSPQLEALAGNGGPTQTMKPAVGSPLRDVVPSAACTNALATDEDQRAVTRPGDTSCEIGAFEVKVPGAPTIGAVTAGNAQASVAFTPPADPGGSAISSYTATCTESSNPTSANGAGTPIIVTGLTNGTAYECGVTATNADGASLGSTTASVTPRTVPGVPTGVTATPGDGQAQVSFTAPGSDGGAAITNYEAACTPTGGGAAVLGSAAGSPMTVSGLTNGTPYACTVHATNAAGDSAESSEANVTPRTVPGAPTIGAVTPGNKQMTVAFTPPASTGGSAITSYTVTATPGGLTKTGVGSPLTVTGLTNGIAYTFKVAATNIAGTGPKSSASTPKTSLFQPDVQARKSTAAAFADINAYATAATAPGNVALGGTATYFAKLFNDGNVSQSINFKALLAGTTKMAVTFKDGAATLTGMTTSGRSFTLAPGASKTITILIKANRGTAKSATRTVTLTAKSNAQTTKTDQVKVKATRI